MTVQRLLLEDLTREDARAVAAEGLVVFPMGATEQHGPHLPAGTDSMHTERIARGAATLVAERIPVAVAPTLQYGCSRHHLPFGATMSLGSDTFYRVVFELSESLTAWGARRLFIVNGHGGNHELVQVVARDLALKHPIHVAAGSWWAMSWDVLIAEGAHERGRVPGHAGAFETSLVLAMRPELVKAPPHREEWGPQSDPRRYEPPTRREIHGYWKSLDGYTDSPDVGEGELGRRYIEVAAIDLAERFLDFVENTTDPVRR